MEPGRGLVTGRKASVMPIEVVGDFERVRFGYVEGIVHRPKELPMSKAGLIGFISQDNFVLRFDRIYPMPFMPTCARNCLPKRILIT
jgi:hypothetical protein